MHLLAYSESSIIGGAEISLATLLSGLDEGIEVTIACTSAAVGGWLERARPSARIRLMRVVEGKKDLPGIADYLRIVRKLRPDVLQANCGHPWGCQFALLAGNLNPGVRTVAVHHATFPAQRRGQLWRNRANLRRTNAQVCVSAHGARTLERWLGLPAGRVRVIPNGVPDLTPQPRPALAAGRVVGAIGRLSTEKGFDVLLRALVLLPEEVTCVLVGDGPERAGLERLAAELGVGHRVVFTGWVERARDHLPGFDLVAVPSRVEAFSLTAVEAALAERCVVGTAIGGIPEAVEDGTTGLLIAPEDPGALADALAGLLDDPERRESLGHAARERALRLFGVDRMAASYEALYRELS